MSKSLGMNRLNFRKEELINITKLSYFILGEGLTCYSCSVISVKLTLGGSAFFKYCFPNSFFLNFTLSYLPRFKQ